MIKCVLIDIFKRKISFSFLRLPIASRLFKTYSPTFRRHFWGLLLIQIDIDFA